MSISRLLEEIDSLAAFSAAPAPAVTRVVFSEEDSKARTWLKARFEEAGLRVRHDAIGNTFARWEGSDPSRKPVATGSHIDAIPNAGKYDGVIGVLGALDAFRSLRESGFSPKAPMEIVLFTSEEPTLFGIGCLGSRLLSGSLSPEAAATLRDRNGKSLDDWRHEAGFAGDLKDAALPIGHFAAFVELHIEQGPLLEREKLAIGIVEKIAAPAAWRVRLEGEGGHAGAVLMPGRRDALLGGAETALAVERLVNTLGSDDGVGTTGVFHVKPGAINSVPLECVLEIDIRDTDHAARLAVEAALKSEIQNIATSRKLEVTVEVINSDPPAICDSGVISVIEAASENLPHRRMISRAYHDSLFLSRIAPTSMIFIPCRNGYSHRPDEYSKPEDIEKGVQVLARTLAALAGTT
ncbi:MAG: M20 family metallo-hydrolase [Terrimicrobiaceae bacterium]